MTTPIGLVVHNDPQVRSFLTEALRRDGMQVVAAMSETEALTFARAITPAFVVTDLEMHDVDGLELCRQLRRHHTTSQAKIVAVGGAAATRGDEARTAGCDAVLPKPCPPAVLVATIRQLLIQSATPDRVIGFHCPRCHSSGARLFRSLRSSAIYLCRDCEHEWEGALPDTES